MSNKNTPWDMIIYGKQYIFKRSQSISYSILSMLIDWFGTGNHMAETGKIKGVRRHWNAPLVVYVTFLLFVLEYSACETGSV